jgi:hypothetical protein
MICGNSAEKAMTAKCMPSISVEPTRFWTGTAAPICLTRLRIGWKLSPAANSFGACDYIPQESCASTPRVAERRWRTFHLRRWPSSAFRTCLCRQGRRALHETRCLDPSFSAFKAVTAVVRCRKGHIQEPQLVHGRRRWGKSFGIRCVADRGRLCFTKHRRTRLPFQSRC